MKKVVIFSLVAVTGGPFAIHQLANAIESFGVPVEVAYMHHGKINGSADFCQFDYEDGFIPPSLLGIDVKLCHEFTREDLLVFPEIHLSLMKTMHNYGFTNTLFWWLSWKNFPIQFIEQLNVAKALHQSKHVFQSEYARQQVQQFGHDGLMLSDYTDTEKVKPIPWELREFDVCYLPRKAEGAESLAEELKASYSVCQLDNMTHVESLEAIANSRVFIDFGSHPGKDRIPREAASLQCIPIVHRAGAAKVSDDVPLPDYLKPDSKLFFLDNHLGNLVQLVMDNHESVMAELLPYRNQIANEKSLFMAQTKAFLTQMQFI